MLDISRLPAPALFKSPDFEGLVAANRAILEELKPDYAWLESDDYMLLIEAFAYRELHLREEFNNRLKATLLHFAKGADLDARAVNYGVARQKDESDDKFRDRILLSLERFSTAGTRGSYAWHARTASVKIDDVKVTRPAPGQVRVYIASFAGALSQAVIAKARAAVDKARPLCDTATVIEAREKAVDVALTVYLTDIDREPQIASVIRQRFARKLKIEETLSVFEMLTHCKVEGVTNAVIDPPATDRVAGAGRRLVLKTLSLKFKKAGAA